MVSRNQPPQRRPGGKARSHGASSSATATKSAPRHTLQAVRQSLHKIQDKYRVLLEITGTGYVLVDGEGTVLDANAEYVRLSGHHEIKEIIGRSLFAWTAEHDRTRNRAALQKAMAKGGVRGLVVDYQWNNGTVIPVEINAASLATKTGTVVVSMCRDISQRWHDDVLMVAQRDLALELGATYELEAGLRLCLRTALRISAMDCGGIYLRDTVAGGMLMLVHEGFSPSFVAAMHRYAPDSPPTQLALRGAPAYQAFDQLGDTFDAVQAIEGLHAIAVIPFHIHGTVIGCMHIASHTTKEIPQFARVALEAIAAQMGNAIGRLRLIEDLHDERGLFVAGPVVMIKWCNDPRQGFPVEYISPNILDQFGYPPDEFLSGRLGYSTLIHPDDRSAHDENARKRKDHLPPWHEEEYRFKHADGTYRWVRDYTITQQSPEGVLTHFLGYIQDITVHKQAEQEKQNLETQMLHAQKLESLGILAGGIAHDFNNILMSILGNIDLVMMDITPESPVYKNLHEAELASRRAADLCRKMLSYAGRGSYQLRSHNLSDIVDDMCHMLEISISKKALLRFDLAQQLPAIEADISQLHQIVMNLVINASEAIGDKSGVIVISTGTMVCDHTFLQTTLLGKGLAEGTYVYLEVADTGCGMDAATRPRIFDPFYSTKGMNRGLGLAAVLGIVRAHHGTVKLTSEPGHGSSFRIVLPLSAEKAAPQPDQNTHGSTWRGTGTLLLVDDEETIRAVGKKMLELLGFTVYIASNGPAAIEIFRTHADDIRGVILDLTMPQMGGDKVFSLLRDIKADLPVLLASGYSEQELAQHLNKQRCVGFIQKPYTIAMLTTKLRALLPAGT